MKIKKFESYDDQDVDNDDYISIEVILNLEPINHSFEVSREEWDSLSEDEKREMVEKSLSELMGEEHWNDIQNGELRYFPMD